MTRVRLDDQPDVAAGTQLERCARRRSEVSFDRVPMSTSSRTTLPWSDNETTVPATIFLALRPTGARFRSGCRRPGSRRESGRPVRHR